MAENVLKKIVEEVELKRITQIKQFPLNTRYEDEGGRIYRYIIDDGGYHWIEEELWYKLQVKITS